MTDRVPESSPPVFFPLNRSRSRREPFYRVMQLARCIVANCQKRHDESMLFLAISASYTGHNDRKEKEREKRHHLDYFNSLMMSTAEFGGRTRQQLK